MKTCLLVGLIFWLVLTLGCAGCNPVTKELGEKPETGKLLESAGKTRSLTSEALGLSRTTVEKASQSAEEAKALARKSPPEMKVDAERHARTAQQVAQAARNTDQAITKADQAAETTLTIAVDVDRRTAVREEKLQSLAKETQALRKGARTGLLATLLAHVALLAGLAAFGGAAYAFIALRSKLLSIMGGVAGVVFVAGYFVTMHQDVVQTGFMALMVLLIVALAVKLVFFRESVIGIAGAVQADEAGKRIAKAADAQTPNGLGSWLGKLKLRVGR